MEAAAILGVIGRIAPMLFGFLHGKYKLLTDLEDDIRSIKDEFNMISAFIEEAVDHPLQTPVAAVWIKMVRDLARDIEDCIDHFAHACELAKSLYNVSITTNTRLEFATAIRKLKKRSEDARRQRETYSTNKQKKKKKKKKKKKEGARDGESSSLDLEQGGPEAYTDVPMGMDAARRELMELISETPQDDPKKLKVISIVGFGGIGKSQLAKYVYNTIDKSEYPERAWVPAEGKVARDVLKEVHKQLQKNSNTSCSTSSAAHEHDSNNLTKLRSRIHQYLRNKRFFVVLDGMLTSNWDDIEGAFPVASGISSRVIVTTVTRSMAAKCSALDGHVYVMRTLDDSYSRELFFKNTRLHFKPEPDDKKLGSQVIKKCDGLPLALVTTAKVLRGNPTEDQWEDLGNNLAQYMEKEDELESLQHVLDRSYTSLRSEQIKTCLLYLGIYPSGRPIRTGSLIRKWLAEGFIKDSDTKLSSFQVAVCNFNELVNQSIIQPSINVSSINSSSNSRAVVKTCQTHGMILEFILRKSMFEEFVTLLYSADMSNSGHSNSSKGKVRWLSVQNNNANNANCKIDKKDLPLVRSLTIFGEADASLMEFSNYKLMKVLDLEECRVEIGDTHLKSICSNLVLLRYLSLGAAVKVTAFPEEIKMLMLLETLDVRRSKIEILPAQAMKLPCLVHLFGKLKLKEDSGLLASPLLKSVLGKPLQAWLSENSKLETLGGFVVDKGQEMAQLIEHMEHLTKVKLWCESTPDTDKINHLRKAVKGFIERGTSQANAPSLSLNFNNTEWHEDLLWLQLKKDRLYYLRSLKLQGNKLCSTLPLFVTVLGGLTKLSLSFPAHTLGTGFFVALPKIPLLEHLKLVASRLENLDISEHALKKLRHLRVVVVEGNGMTCVKFQEGALPRLESLWLLCKDLNGFSGRIKPMSVLKEVVLHDGLSHQAKQQWKNEAKDHCKRPQVLFAKTEHITSESAVKISFVAPTTDTTAQGVAVPTTESESAVTSEIIASVPATATDHVLSMHHCANANVQKANNGNCFLPGDGPHDDPEKKCIDNIDGVLATQNGMEWLNTMLERSNVNDTSPVMLPHSPLPKTRPRSPTSAITCSPSKLRKNNNVPEEFVGHVNSEGNNASEGDEIIAIVEEVVKCGASDMCVE